jgi:phosphoribosylformylglycinamidine synthase
MLILTGAPALSDFRLAKLESSIRARIEGVAGLDSRYLHFVDLERPLTPEETAVLESLLRYGPAGSAAAPTGALLLALPRIGTVSPWSSKATDIARVCGLAAVRRIERGVAWYLRGNRRLGEVDLVAAGTLLHDRMTQSLVSRHCGGRGALLSCAPPAIRAHRAGSRGARCCERVARTCVIGRGDRLPGRGLRSHGSAIRPMPSS